MKYLLVRDVIFLSTFEQSIETAALLNNGYYNSAPVYPIREKELSFLFFRSLKYTHVFSFNWTYENISRYRSRSEEEEKKAQVDDALK